MNKFVIGVSKLVENVCHSTILIPCMNISSIMVHAKQIEEKNIKKINKEVKMERKNDAKFSNSWTDKQCIHRTNKGILIKILPTPFGLPKEKKTHLVLMWKESLW